MTTMKPQLVVINDDDDEVSIPCHFAVCDRCNGTGVHDHPAFSNGLSSEDFDEDEDFRGDYMRGCYDVTCSECNGLRVVASPSVDLLTIDQKRWLENGYQARNEAAAERRMRDRGIQF